MRGDTATKFLTLDIWCKLSCHNVLTEVCVCVGWLVLLEVRKSQTDYRDTIQQNQCSFDSVFRQHTAFNSNALLFISLAHPLLGSWQRKTSSDEAPVYINCYFECTRKWD